MKVFVHRYGKKRIECRVPFEGADHVLGADPCPFCGDEPLKVAGCNRRIAKDDRAYEADAIALCCGVHVGTWVRCAPRRIRSSACARTRRC